MKKYSQAKEFLIIMGKSKSSLHGLTNIEWFRSNNRHLSCHFSISNVLFAFWVFYSKTGKTLVSHRVKMMTRWPGRERWPSDPVPCLLFTAQIKYLHCLAKRSLEWYFVIDASKFCKVVKVVCPRPKDRNRKKLLHWIVSENWISMVQLYRYTTV